MKAKTLAEYSPRKLTHVKRDGNGLVELGTLKVGDLVLATEAGYCDLVEVAKIEMVGQEIVIWLLYHTSLNAQLSEPEEFCYSESKCSGAGLFLRVFDEETKIPPRYCDMEGKVSLG